MGSFAEMACKCPDEFIDTIRELLSYDVQCPASCLLLRKDNGCLGIAQVPSPLHWSRQIEWPWALHCLQLQPHHTVLDIGGGWSVLKYAMANRCRHVQSLDIDQDSIEKAQFTINKLSMSHKIHQTLGDALALPFGDESFDRVTCISVLEHIPDKQHLNGVREAIRVLKPGGIAVITMDVVIDGVGKSNFHVDQDDAVEVLSLLGIPSITENENRGMAVSFIKEHDVWIAVIMMCYHKPEKEYDDHDTDKEVG